MQLRVNGVANKLDQITAILIAIPLSIVGISLFTSIGIIIVDIILSASRIPTEGREVANVFAGMLLSRFVVAAVIAEAVNWGVDNRYSLQVKNVTIICFVLTILIFTFLILSYDYDRSNSSSEDARDISYDINLNFEDAVDITRHSPESIEYFIWPIFSYALFAWVGVLTISKHLDPRTKKSNLVFLKKKEHQLDFFQGGFQLIKWFLFDRVRWRRYVGQIDPYLSPNFCLIELTREKWQLPEVKRLISSYLTLLLIFNLTIALILSLYGELGPMVFIIAFTVSFSLLLSLIGSLESGIIGGLAIAPIALIISAVITNEWFLIEGVIYSIGDLNLPKTINAIKFDLQLTTGRVVIGGIIFGLIGSVISGFPTKLSKTKPNVGLFQTFGLIAASVLIGIVVLFIVYHIVVVLDVIFHFSSFHLVKIPILSSVMLILLVCISATWNAQSRNREDIIREIGAAGGLASILALVIAFTVCIGIIIDEPYSVNMGLAFGFTFGALLSLPYMFAKHITSTFIAGIAGIVGSSIFWVLLIITGPNTLIEKTRYVAIFTMAGVIASVVLAWSVNRYQRR